MTVKGNVFKNKREAMEDPHIAATKKTLPDQFEARRAKKKASRERNFTRSQGVIPAVVPKDLG